MIGFSSQWQQRYVAHVKFHCPNDNEKALWVTDFKLSKPFTEPGVEGNPIGLLIVILPECDMEIMI
jgi:hypothetical protein